MPVGNKAGTLIETSVGVPSRRCAELDVANLPSGVFSVTAHRIAGGRGRPCPGKPDGSAASGWGGPGCWRGPTGESCFSTYVFHERQDLAQLLVLVVMRNLTVDDSAFV